MKYGVTAAWKAWNSAQQQPTSAEIVERSRSCSQPDRIAVWMGNSGPWHRPKMKRHRHTP